MRPSCAAAALAALACACAHGAAGAGQPCELELLAEQPPPPFEVVGSVQALVTTGGDHPEDALRAPACALGADAVVVTRRFVTNDYGHVLVGGIAVRRKVEPAPAPTTAPPGQVDL